jgi:hypothetical protein
MRSFCDALPADVVRHIRNLQRRRRYQQNLDRPKVWPGNVIPHDLAAFWWRNPNEARQLLALLGATDDTATYVAAWCRLNHLCGAEV